MAKPIYEDPLLDPMNLLLVDSLNLAFRWKHSNNDFEMPKDFMTTVKSLAKSYDCGKIILLGDGGSSWRRKKYPEYKAARRKKREEQTAQEKKDWDSFMSYYQETLDNADVPVIKLSGVEADDIAAYIVENKYTYNINTVWLITSDRDWDLLLEEDVHRFSTHSRKEFTLDNWEYPVPPEQYIEMKTLTGDAGDDVPGVKGIGPSFAARLLNQYGDIYNLLDAMPLPGKAKYIQNLNEKSKEELLLAMELMDLRGFHEDAIGEHLPELKERLEEIYGN